MRWEGVPSDADVTQLQDGMVFWTLRASFEVDGITYAMEGLGPGHLTVRPMIEVLDPGRTRRWHWSPGIEVDEELWLAVGVVRPIKTPSSGSVAF